MATSVVLVLYNQLALTRACLEGLRSTTRPFELCVVDNASSDGTEAFFREWAAGTPLRYHRNADNVGLIRALNQGAGRVGLAGLYGVRRLRRDGRYAGRTIVHALEGQATLRRPVTEVAAVDGVCLFLPRAILDAVGGFDEGYGFFHGYDRDLSFAVREAGWRCAVVDAPFAHRGGGTRTGEGAPRGIAADLAERREALRRFAG